MPSSSQLVVASTRLPVSLSQDEDGAWQASPSPGGLATALRAVATDRSFRWVGWPGTVVPEEDEGTVRQLLADHSGAVPVFLSEADHEGFYEKLSNRFLWPLLHMMPTPRRFDLDAWAVYRDVNQRFADAIADVVEPGDTVWVHDYQLALVPGMLRERGLDVSMGYFLHIPFPSSEVMRTLPVREEIMRGILGADLIGFHVYEYVSHFRTAALRILGAESDPDLISVDTHRARLGVFPIGIDAEGFRDLAHEDAVAKERDELRTHYGDCRVVLGVDRMDYTKGLPEKLMAFGDLLERRPDLREEVVLIQIASPSRTGVVEYQELKRDIDELVGDLNGRYSTVDHQPVVYINQHVPHARLAALYQIADVMLVTPLRDGMNLVCLEYVAARDEPGSLVLSEFAGAAHCLGGAVLVNPHNQRAVSEALEQVLDADIDAAAFEHLRRFTFDNTSKAWAQRFLDTLDRAREELAPPTRPFTPTIVAEQGRPKHPLVLLDYDGTLAPHVAVPSHARPSERAHRVLERLAEHALVYVVSGRPRSTLEEWLGHHPIGLCCEHGLRERPAGGEWSDPPRMDRTPLTELVEPLLADFTARTPGSHVERKSASIAWHYRRADPKLGTWRAQELRRLLDRRLADTMYTVLAGSKVVEIRHVHVTKGEAVHRALARHPEVDFVLCCGNDRTDEDMFEALEHVDVASLSCRVGESVATRAATSIATVDALLGVLEQVAEDWAG